jgi:hypothetical protein
MVSPDQPVYARLEPSKHPELVAFSSTSIYESPPASSPLGIRLGITSCPFWPVTQPPTRSPPLRGDLADDREASALGSPADPRLIRRTVVAARERADHPIGAELAGLHPTDGNRTNDHRNGPRRRSGPIARNTPVSPVHSPFDPERNYAFTGERIDGRGISRKLSILTQIC